MIFFLGKFVTKFVSARYKYEPRNFLFPLVPVMNLIDFAAKTVHGSGIILSL